MRALLSGGAGLIIAYTGMITLADAITKQLAAGYSAAQMFALSGAVVVALCIGAARIGPARESLRTTRPVAMTLRAAATVLAAVFFFLAFRHLPFSDVFLFVGLMPLIAALLAGPVLGEAVSRLSWGALAAGFVGVLCLFPQGLSGVGFGHLAALLAALAGTVSIVLSRHIARYESNSLAQVFYPNLALCLVMAAGLPFVWQPMPLADVGWAVAYGVALFAARWLLVLALRGLAAHAATSLMKLQFVWMVAIGALVFGEWPATGTFVGVAIVIGSGLLLVYEDQIRAPRRLHLKRPLGVGAAGLDRAAKAPA